MTDLEKLQLRVERAKRRAKETVNMIKKLREVYAPPSASVALNTVEGYVMTIINALEGNDD